MRIGVVADTHMPRFGRHLPDPLAEGLAGVDQILHLGDFISIEAVKLFEAIAPVDAVAGNNDPPEIRERFGRKKIVEWGGVRLGLIHGDGTRLTTQQRAVEAFQNDDVAVILYGHSHIPVCEKQGNLWVVNPGSPTDKRRQPRFSFALIDVIHGQVRPQLRFF